MEPRRQKHLSKLEHDRKQKEFASGLPVSAQSSRTDLLNGAEASRRIAERTVANAAASASVDRRLPSLGAASDDFSRAADAEDGDGEFDEGAPGEILDGHADRRFLKGRQQGAGAGGDGDASANGMFDGDAQDVRAGKSTDEHKQKLGTARGQGAGLVESGGPGDGPRAFDVEDLDFASEDEGDYSDDDDDGLVVSVSTGDRAPGTSSRRSKAAGSGGGGDDAFQDEEHFMSYLPRNTNLAEDRALSVHKGSGNAADFLLEARGATLDMGGDESKGMKEASRAGSGMRWDKKGKKYVSRANDLDGSKEGKAKYIRGESGQKIAATFRSGRFEAWKKRERIERMPRVGEREAPSAASNAPGRQRWKHKQERAPKEADKWRDDYHVRKKRVAEAREKRVGRFKDGQGKSEIKSLDDMAKGRRLKERRREKNARPQRKGKK